MGNERVWYSRFTARSDYDIHADVLFPDSFHSWIQPVHSCVVITNVLIRKIEEVGHGFIESLIQAAEETDRLYRQRIGTVSVSG